MISDIHLGHRRTPTEHIVKNLYTVLNDMVEVSTWDMLVIPGDLLDRVLGFNDDENLSPIFRLGDKILRTCEKNDIVLRILEGTPAHDRKQSKYLEYLSRISGRTGKLDFKYVDTLSIEYIERFNIHVLYVPDEWHHDVFVTYDDTKTLLKQRNLNTVDFCFFHGAFNYQIDERLNPKAHNEELWSSLVKYYLFAGHVHYRSQYKNIIVPGSFDRLAHGEEEPKGWITCEIRSEDEHVLLFHENQNAMVYKTIDVRGMTVEEMLPYIEEQIKDIKGIAYVRLWVSSRSEMRDGLETLKKQHSYLRFSLKVDETKNKKVEKTIRLVESKFQPIDLTKENIPRLIEERLEKIEQFDYGKIVEYLKKYI